MISALVTNPSAYLIFTIMAAGAGLAKIKGRVGFAGLPAIIATVMFVVSTFLMNAWREFDTMEAQIFVWRHGLLADALLYLAILLWFGWREYLINAILAIGVLYLFMRWTGEVEQIGAVGLTVVIAALCLVGYRLVRSNDLFGILTWGILLIGEAAAAINTVDCQLFHGMFGVRRTGSACEQIYGVEVGLWTAGLCGLFLLYVWMRLLWPRKP